MQTMANEEALASVQAEATRFGNEIQLEKLIARAKLSKVALPLRTLPEQSEVVVKPAAISHVDEIGDCDVVPTSSTDGSLINVDMSQAEPDINL